MSNRNAVFTMRFKDVIEVLKGDKKTGVNIGLDTYPLFDPDYRERLNERIVDHYWNREIGRESIEDFRFALARMMREIMPYYNQLYLTERIRFDPLSTMSIKSVNSDSSEMESKGDSESKSNANSEADAVSVANTFPQTAMNDNDNGEYGDSGNESTSKSKNDSEVAENRNETTKSNSDSESNTSGYTGAASDLLTRFRDTLLNIDMMIVTDLNILFMNIWDTGDTYSESGYIA